ncbi:MAG: ATP-binding protein [Fibrobacter sp.]|nr:ATP-binding protein [Fibrobacter sp.]
MQKAAKMYFSRLIDRYLKEWANSPRHKPLLLRGARQVGKSSAVRHLGENFEHMVEINFEKHPEFKAVFTTNLDVSRIVSELSAITGTPIVAGKTLLFLDEIQGCVDAIMSLRFFKEDMPDLHVVAAGSLLEFALNDIPTFGVGRIHSMFMHPMTFDEFLEANGQIALLKLRNQSSPQKPLPQTVHDKLVEYFRTYMLVGGMPESVVRWVQSHDYLECQAIQDDILVTYEDDFAKYKKKVDPTLLRKTFQSIASQITHKFTYSKVGEYRTEKVQEALHLLTLAGLAIPVTRSSANGLPLGSEADSGTQKVLLLDPGLQLRLQNLNLGDISEIISQILTASGADLVNKGTLAEMVAGLEILRYKTPNIRHEIFYWSRTQRNSLAEVDYLDARNARVTPIEVKAGTQGGMKSLWIMMREKKLTSAYRCSLENFGEFDYVDSLDNNAIRHVEICPLYALSQM